MNRIIAEYLPEAYSDNSDCPPPECWAAVINRDMPESEYERLGRHAQSCQACASERKLAERFLEDLAESDEDVAWLVSRLEKSRPAAGNVIRFPQRFGRYAQPLLGLAAAAMLALAFAPLLPTIDLGGAPTAPEGSGTLRGATVTVVAPAGDLRSMPGQLEWRELEEARRYRLTLYAVDGEVLWRDQTNGAYDSIALPEELLQPYTVYSWQVEALDDAGDIVAASRPTRFRVLGKTR